MIEDPELQEYFKLAGFVEPVGMHWLLAMVADCEVPEHAVPTKDVTVMPLEPHVSFVEPAPVVLVHWPIG